MEVLSESINKTTAGSEQIFDAIDGRGVAVGVYTGVKVATMTCIGVSVETMFMKSEAGVVEVGAAGLPILQPLSRYTPITNTGNIFFCFMKFSSLTNHYILVVFETK